MVPESFGSDLLRLGDYLVTLSGRNWHVICQIRLANWIMLLLVIGVEHSLSNGIRQGLWLVEVR